MEGWRVAASETDANQPRLLAPLRDSTNVWRPPFSTLLYYPVATSPPFGAPLLRKSLQNSASHLLPHSSPLLPSMVRITLYSAALLPACGALPGRLGLAAQPAAAASETWPPTPPSACKPQITLLMSFLPLDWRSKVATRPRVVGSGQQQLWRLEAALCCAAREPGGASAAAGKGGPWLHCTFFLTSSDPGNGQN